MAMQEKLAAILALEAVGPPEPTVSEAAAARELGAIQCELVDPTISRYGGRIFALTPSRTLAEFAEAATAVCCGIEIQRGMAERNGELPVDRQVQLRAGIDLGEVASLSGDLAGAPVVVAQGLARSAAAGAVAVSASVARRIERRRPAAAIARRGRLALAGGGRLEVVELRPVAAPKAQSPWPLRRRWTWIAALAAVVLLLGAAVVLWRPIRDWILPLPGATASDGPSAPAPR
jgi:hypothetical protein